MQIHYGYETHGPLTREEHGFAHFDAVFRIRKSFHADPDPGSQKFPYGFRNQTLIFYSDSDPDPDPKGLKNKEDNLYQQIFN